MLPLNDIPLAFWTTPVWQSLPVRYGFTHRTGGVSAAPFASLNLGVHVGDDADAVVENRRRVTEALGFSLATLVCAEQIHGANVVRVHSPDAGRGAVDYATAIPGTDALMTDTPDLLLGLYFADCLPIFLLDTRRPAIALAHAGWRGLVNGVIANTVGMMQREFATDPHQLQAVIGPGISAAAFEVGREVAAYFPDETRVHPVTDRPHVDLTAAAVRLLCHAGLPAANIAVSTDCTATQPERYFSHRRDQGRTGRMGAFIGLPPFER